MLKKTTVPITTYKQSNQKKNNKKVKKKPLKLLKSTHPIVCEIGSKPTKRIKGQLPSFLQARKESYLNSCYNKRRRALVEVTRENHRLYKRINSQQSQYCSQKSLNKSRMSNKSISMSRKSNNNNKIKGSGISSNKQPHSFKWSRTNSHGVKDMKIAHQNIHKVEGKTIETFGKIFQVKSEHFTPARTQNMLVNKQNLDGGRNTKSKLEDIYQFNDKHFNSCKSSQIKGQCTLGHPYKDRRAVSAVQRVKKSEVKFKVHENKV